MKISAATPPGPAPDAAGPNVAGPNVAMRPRHYDIRIARDGTWFHEGQPILRQELVRLFARALRREPDGSYWLVTPYERGPITVEDAPFLTVELAVESGPEGPVLRVRTNLDAWITVDGDHPLVMHWEKNTGESVPYVLGEGGLPARLTRAVYYALAERAEPDPADPQRLGVRSRGGFFALGRLEDDPPE